MKKKADDSPKPESPTADVIDLSLYAQTLMEYLAESITDFATDHPDTEVSCIGLYFTNYGSSVFINYETQRHSDAQVESSGRKVQFGVSEDQEGFFNSDQYDFEFNQYGEFAYKSLPNFYNVKWPIEFRDLFGKVTKVDSKDESVGRVLLASMQPALQTFDSFGGPQAVQSVSNGDLSSQHPLRRLLASRGRQMNTAGQA